MSMFEEKVEEKKVVEEETSSEPTKQETTKTDDEGFAEMLNGSFVDTDRIVEGDVVEGKVIAINDSYIFVSLGGKHEAFAEVDDFKSKAGKLKVEVGDSLRGFVVKKTDSEIVISKSLNRKYVDKSFLNNAYNEKIPVKAKIVSIIKGGFSVEMLGTRAFCPFSQSDVRFVSDPASMVGNYYEFLITEIPGDMKRIVVSRRALLEDELQKQKEETLADLNVGDVVTGVVTRIANFGAFVDLGGIDALLHISQLSWVKVNTPKDVVNIGDEIEAKVIAINGEKISLSMKQLQTNPLDNALEELQVGDVVDCRILRNESFGSFCELKPGVEGLIPISEMIHNTRLSNPSELFAVGDLVSAQIIRIMKNEKKISLSVKALKPDPWDNIEDVISEGEAVDGVIDGVTNFGVFVRVSEGLIGLLPKSKLFRTRSNFSEEDVNTPLKVRISQIDREQKRLSLDLADAPPENFDRGFDKPQHQQQQNFQSHGRRPKNERTDWRNYNSPKQEVPEDNPFSDL